jgi:hypothetical protein
LDFHGGEEGDEYDDDPSFDAVYTHWHALAQQSSTVVTCKVGISTIKTDVDHYLSQEAEKKHGKNISLTGRRKQF